MQAVATQTAAQVLQLQRLTNMLSGDVCTCPAHNYFIEYIITMYKLN